MSDTYKFRRQEFRKELLEACYALIKPQVLAEDVYKCIMLPFEDFLSEHEVKGADDE